MLEYACTLWDGCSQQDSDYLEKLQLETVRIVTGLITKIAIVAL
jgi:hypothetical protein